MSAVEKKHPERSGPPKCGSAGDLLNQRVTPREDASKRVRNAQTRGFTPVARRIAAVLGIPIVLGFLLARAALTTEMLSSTDHALPLYGSAGSTSAEIPVSSGTGEDDLEASHTALFGETAEAGSLDARVQSQLRLLGDEHARLQRYETQIKKRLQSLDVALDELDQLEMESARESDAPAKRAERGASIGGGDGPHAPMIHLEGHRKDSSFATRSRNAQSDARQPDAEHSEITPVPGASGLTPSAAVSGVQVPMLMGLIEREISRLSATPLGAPVQGPISSDFGWRSQSEGRGHFHQGIDISIDQLSPVVATADGIVVNAGPKGAYGYCVIVEHRGGYETLFGHLARISVKPGDRICRGERIGYAGSTGRSTGPHLHYEIKRHGTALNPAPFIELASLLRLTQAEPVERAVSPVSVEEAVDLAAVRAVERAPL